jgi:HlyD family secretion protein
METDLKSLQIDRSKRRDPQPGPSKWAVRWILVGVGLFVLLGAGRFVYEATANAATEVETMQVSAASAGAAGRDVVLNATGYIVAHHSIDVSSKVTGKVEWVGVEKGDHVKEGGVLVKLEDAEFLAQLDQARANFAVAQAHLSELEHGSRPQEIAAARAQDEQARADLENDALILKRTSDLVKQGILPQQQLDSAQAANDMAKAKLDNSQKNTELVELGPRAEEIEYARGQVAQAKAQVEYAQTMFDATQIRSPVTGTVLDRLVEKGEMVSNMSLGTGGVKASVVSVADLNDLQVELDISQNDFAKVTPRDQCDIVADAYPERVYKGVIAEIAPEANRQKATIQVKVKVLQPDEYLRPEMNASVAFVSEDKPAANGDAAAQPVIVVPATAVKDDAVFVVLGSKAIRRPVKTGPTSGQGVRIEQGLIGGEGLIVNPPASLKDGDRVRRKSS